jgi:hypothetical protein
MAPARPGGDLFAIKHSQFRQLREQSTREHLPTPGTERSNSSRSRHRGVSRINSASSYDDRIERVLPREPVDRTSCRRRTELRRSARRCEAYRDQTGNSRAARARLPPARLSSKRLRPRESGGPDPLPLRQFLAERLVFCREAKVERARRSKV